MSSGSLLITHLSRFRLNSCLCHVPSVVDLPAVSSETTAESTRPDFRRPTREDAINLARARFISGERVEMQVLAAELDIGRTTLYRWVGEREQLLEEVFAGLVDEWFAAGRTPGGRVPDATVCWT